MNVIGDSMLSFSMDTWHDTFDQAGIPANFRAAPAVEASEWGPSFVQQLRAASGDAPCWIVVMGTNDVLHIGQDGRPVDTGEPCNSNAARRAEADRRINLVNATIGDHHRIFWFNVYNGWIPDMTCVWNGQLKRMNIGVIDWYGSFSQHPEWSVDGVHTTAAGDRERANLALNAVR